jgi:hypothetical protein
MRRRTRLVFLGVAVVSLLLVGWLATGNLRFLLADFWFTAGLFLLLLLTLVDQPHFSRDASIFVNGATAWISLLLVPPSERMGLWWVFFAWALYLVIASYGLMWMRSQSLGEKTKVIQLVTRVNRQIGRPEAIFSAFFLWGCVRQFGVASPKLQPLFLFWAVFMILNLPALARALDGIFAAKQSTLESNVGTVSTITSPRTAEALLAPELQGTLAGRSVLVRNRGGTRLAEGIIVDDRIVAGRRIGTISLTSLESNWSSVGTPGAASAIVDLIESERSATEAEDGTAS